MLHLYKPNIPKGALKEITKSLENGNLIYGNFCKGFENDFSEYQNLKYSLAVSSGTAALHLALLALDIKKGDIVFIPDFTWSSTVNVIEFVGAIPIFIDVDLKNYCMDIDTLETKVSEYEEIKGKKVILPVHQHGYPMDMEKINIIARKHDCFVIEDAACAIGSELNGKKLGSFSDISCFSFHPRKILTTGEGGMVSTHDSVLSERLRRFLNHGFKADMKDYEFPGLNYRMTEMQAILGIYGLKEVDINIKTRKELKDIYFQSLLEFEEITLPEDNIGHNWQTFLVTLNENINRDSFLERLNNNGINLVKSSNSLTSLEYFINKYGKNLDVPNSRFISSQGVALPFCEAYGAEEVNLVKKEIKKELSDSR